jgi:hypothetical protein
LFDGGIEALALVLIPAGALSRELANLQRFAWPLLLVAGSDDHASVIPSKGR